MPQAQVEGGAPPPDAARDAAEKTLAALTEQNQRLAADKAAADAAAKDAAVDLLAAQADMLTPHTVALLMHSFANAFPRAKSAAGCLGGGGSNLCGQGCSDGSAGCIPVSIRF